MEVLKLKRLSKCFPEFNGLTKFDSLEYLNSGTILYYTKNDTNLSLKSFNKNEKQFVKRSIVQERTLSFIESSFPPFVKVSMQKADSPRPSQLHDSRILGI